MSTSSQLKSKKPKPLVYDRVNIVYVESTLVYAESTLVYVESTFQNSSLKNNVFNHFFNGNFSCPAPRNVIVFC